MALNVHSILTNGVASMDAARGNLGSVEGLLATAQEYSKIVGEWTSRGGAGPGDAAASIRGEFEKKKAELTKALETDPTTLAAARKIVKELRLLAQLLCREQMNLGGQRAGRGRGGGARQPEPASKPARQTAPLAPFSQRIGGKVEG